MLTTILKELKNGKKIDFVVVLKNKFYIVSDSIKRNALLSLMQ